MAAKRRRVNANTLSRGSCFAMGIDSVEEFEVLSITHTGTEVKVRIRSSLTKEIEHGDWPGNKAVYVY